jgi:arylsulfatase A-like enzyme
LGFTGSQIRTPNIDALAASGVLLKSFYVQRACSPTRAALLTGRYNIRYGFQSGVLKDLNNYSLPLAETLLPAFVKRAVPAAATHAVGKWHVGYHSWQHTPAFRGFDSYLGYVSGSKDYFTHEGDCGGFDMLFQDGAHCGAGCARSLWEARGVYSTHLFTARAVDLIRAHDPAVNGTLFLYLPFQGVHVPDQVPPSYMKPYNFAPVEGTDARNYLAGMLAAVDEGIGNVTAALRARGMLDDTLIWLQTDNGAATPACGGWSGAQNFPLRGGKCTLWEGGQRGVALVSGAGIAPTRRGAVEGAIMHTIDVLPTLVAALGGNATALSAPGFPLDGVSQWALLSMGVGPAPRDTVLLEADPFASPVDNHPPLFQCTGDEHATRYYGLRSGQWKLMLGDPGATFNRTGIGSGWWCTGPPCPSDHNNSAAVGGPFPVDGALLYDVVADPTETTDLAAQHPDVVERLTQLILALNATAVPSGGVCAPPDPGQSPALHNGTCVPWA